MQVVCLAQYRSGLSEAGCWGLAVLCARLWVTGGRCVSLCTVQVTCGPDIRVIWVCRDHRRLSVVSGGRMARSSKMLFGTVCLVFIMLFNAEVTIVAALINLGFSSWFSVSYFSAPRPTLPSQELIHLLSHQNLTYFLSRAVFLFLQTAL